MLFLKPDSRIHKLGKARNLIHLFISITYSSLFSPVSYHYFHISYPPATISLIILSPSKLCFRQGTRYYERPLYILYSALSLLALLASLATVYILTLQRLRHRSRLVLSRSQLLAILPTYHLQVCKNGSTGLNTNSSTVLLVRLPSWARH